MWTVVLAALLCPPLMFLLGASEGSDIQEWEFKTSKQPHGFKSTVLKRHQAVSLLMCSVKCSLLTACVTFQHKRWKSSCTVYRRFRDNDVMTVTTSSVPGVIYLTANAPCKGQHYGKRCSNNAECLDHWTQCIDQVCRCQPGYSFNPGSCSCIEVCAEYGTTSSLLSHGYCITGYNDAVYVSVSSPEGCRKKCVRQKSFLCKSFEIWLNGCYLSRVTKLDVEARKWRLFHSCSYFQRNCG
ncbi:uncharacterized protein LOC124124146 [Haliotis rufescens]|uniref:uncharacterized protein LOC124124146 n=1 Tax=Haliotis rufescens TaxID=6454 RepID=UPI00201F67AD|nr:uncharacterized protein LOC124124146 [Haliotis rufescens]